MTKVITLDLAQELLERAVAEKGADYVYDKSDGTCMYVKDGAPSCIVGHALSYLGLPIEELEKMDEPSAYFTDDMGIPMDSDSGIMVVADVLASDYHINIDADALDLFALAQQDQDAGHPWGDAVEGARRAVVVGN